MRAYVLLIAGGHGLIVMETHSRRATEADFASEFNQFFCSMQTLQVCLDGDEQRVLALAGRGGESTPASLLCGPETVADTAFATWGRCAAIVIGNDSAIRRTIPNPPY